MWGYNAGGQEIALNSFDLWFYLAAGKSWKKKHLPGI